MAERVTISLDGMIAMTEAGDRLGFVFDDGRGCQGCFFNGRCVSSGNHVFPSETPACMAPDRKDRRNGHWEEFD